LLRSQGDLKSELSYGKFFDDISKSQNEKFIKKLKIHKHNTAAQSKSTGHVSQGITPYLFLYEHCNTIIFKWALNEGSTTHQNCNSSNRPSRTPSLT
jgi:hypothetical protein